MTAPYWQSRLLWELQRARSVPPGSWGATAVLSPDAGLGRAMTTPSYEHEPVLLKEVLELLVTDRGGLYLDATLGLGGHAEALLGALSERGRLLGLDLDPETQAIACARLRPFGERFRAARANFRGAGDVVERERFFPLAGALFDLGVSSLHFDKPERGFSFQKEGPLDMRLSPDNPLTAAAIVNRWPEEQLELLFKEYGEEPNARRAVKAIAARRAKKPFETTTDLAEVLASKLPRGRTHAATRIFMALRIAVNAELENLTRGLEGVLPHLQHGGRLAVITFHSLEDRIVKRLFASFVEQGVCRFPGQGGGREAVKPSREEVAKNARARSAKLRVVEKL